MPASSAHRNCSNNRALGSTKREKYHYRGPFYPKIQSLPTELLLEIFLQYCAICEGQVEARSKVSRTKPLKSHSWIIRITHVCSLWRNVAISYPLLWSLVRPCEPALFSTILGRSQEALLSVEFSDRYGDMKFDPQDLDRILRMELHRVERLSLQGRLLEDVKRKYGKQWLYTLMTNTTSIRSLSVSRIDFCDVSALSQPKLSSLSLNFRRHTSVELQPTLTSLLDVLSKLPSLTSLYLQNLPALCGTPKSASKVSLGKLNYLQLSGNLLACHGLLRFLNLRPQVRVFLDYWENPLTMASVIDVIDLLGSTFYPSGATDVSNPLASLSFMQGGPYINIQGWTSPVLAQDFSNRVTQGKAKFHFKIKSRPEYCETWMKHLHTRLRLDHIESLHISQASGHGDTETNTWASIRAAIRETFGNSTSLHTLAVCGVDSYHLASLLDYSSPYLKLDCGLFPELKHVLAADILWPDKSRSHPVGYSVLSALQMRRNLLPLLTLHRRHINLAQSYIIDNIIPFVEGLNLTGICLC